MSRNVAASIRDRLKQHADASRTDFNLTLTRYGLERLLYRLSVSPHATNFMLKGALLFSLWYDHQHRPTRDADLLAAGDSDMASMVDTFREVARIESTDGLVFQLEAIRGSIIRKSAGYGGVRIDLPAFLAGARLSLQVDVGFGDAVTPAPERIQYPTLLPGLPAPLLLAYPKHSVIAEKLHAICLLGMANTRMKDYFDLDVLLHDEAVEPSLLRQAVRATFLRRKLTVPNDAPAGLGSSFANDAGKQTQWRAFLRKNALQADDLPAVVQRLVTQLRLRQVF